MMLKALAGLTALTAGQNTLPVSTLQQDPFGGFLTVLGALLALVLVLFLAVKGTRLIGRRYGATTGTSEHIEVLERVALTPTEALLVVRAGAKILLLGQTAHSICRLDELDPALYEGVGGSPQPGEVFSQLLKDTVSGLGRQKQRENADE